MNIKCVFFFFSSRRRHTRWNCDWSSDVCSSDLPLGLRMVEELLAARGIIVSHETVRQWARKFGQQFAKQIRRRLPRVGDKWHLDEVALKIAGVKHWLWRSCSTSWCNADATSKRPSDCCASC